MKKSISKSLVLFGMVLMFALSLVFGLSANVLSSANADTVMNITTIDTSLLSVEVYGHDNSKLTTTDYASNITLTNGSNQADNWSCETYKWRDVRNFKISLNLDKLTDAMSYNYNYSVSWVPVQIVDNKAVFDTDHSIVRPLFNSNTNENVSTSSKEEIINEVYFTIDNNTLQTTSTTIIGAEALGEKYTKNGGWGLYIFTFTDPIIGAKQSQIFQITPDSIEGLAKPIISFKAVKSTERVNSAFDFSVDASYKYVKRDLIYWSITGTGKDGRSYVLTPQDIINPNTTNYVFPEEAVERTGLVFHFDPPIEGTWKAECGIYKDVDHTQRYETAFSEKVSTVKGLSTQSLIWIVAGAAAAVGLIVAITIIVSIKKEKVY